MSTDIRDAIFTKDGEGNSIVKHDPYQWEYVVTDNTGPFEKAIAEQMGFKLVQTDDEGYVTVSLQEHVHGEMPADASDYKKWKALRGTLNSEFRPKPKGEPAAADAPAVNREFAELKVQRGHPGGQLVTETFEDGCTVTSYVSGPRTRAVEPEAPARAVGFNPYAVTMGEYSELRRKGLTPDVRIVGAPSTGASESFDLPAYREYKAERAKAEMSEMDQFIEARRRGEIPA